MRKFLVMATLLMATSAAGQWDGWPLKGNTNASTWTEANKNYAPISQLWYAAQERYVAFPSEEDPGGMSLTYTLPAGTNLEAVVTNGITYTNVLLVTTNVAVLYEFTGSPTNYGDIVYSYTDIGGAHVSTGKPGLVADGTYSILSFIEYAFTYWDNSVTELSAIERFLITNAATGGTMDSYFATSAAGTYPSAFIEGNMANLYYYEDVGFATNLTTNIWGYVTGSSNFNYNAAFRVNPPRTQDWAMAESHYTGTWAFVDVGTFPGSTLREGWQGPSWRYLSGGTNPIYSMPFTITGTIWGAWSFGAGTFRPVRATVATSETVTVTSSNGTFSGEWYDISGISCPSNAPNTTDVFIVYYTNVPTAYIASTPFRNRRLYAENLDAFQRLINAMQWTDAGTLSWVADAANNEYVWTANSTSSWADAKSVCATSAPAIATANTLAESGTEGSYNGSQWSATATARKSKLVTPSVPTNTSHQINWYVKGTTNDIGTYDDFGYGVSNGFYRLFSTNDPTSDSIVTQAVGIGSTSFPPAWCDEPFVGTNTARGYKVNGQLGLSKWLFRFRN